eukprot:177948-Pleurochrysis_carterae.AAC.1
MEPGADHVKRWSTPTAGVELVHHELRTVQPRMHQFYRENMNPVDLHNKLRQGVCAMADIWSTHSWPECHFAEMLGFTEVNIFKALKYFNPARADLTHGDLRCRLAYALVTLGNAEYPDTASTQSST